MSFQFHDNTPPIVTIPDPDSSPRAHSPLDSGTDLPEAAHTLLKQLAAWDPASARHCGRVAAAATSLGHWLGLDADTLKRLRLAAYLHDIGKLRTRRTILQKPDRLTDEEYAEIRSHAATGAEILRSDPTFDDIIDIVHCHHERWDGDGYPAGLDSTDIPLESRIIAVVDTWTPSPPCDPTSVADPNSFHSPRYADAPDRNSTPTSPVPSLKWSLTASSHNDTAPKHTSQSATMGRLFAPVAQLDRAELS